MSWLVAISKAKYFKRTFMETKIYGWVTLPFSKVFAQVEVQTFLGNGPPHPMIQMLATISIRNLNFRNTVTNDY